MSLKTIVGQGRCVFQPLKGTLQVLPSLQSTAKGSVLTHIRWYRKTVLDPKPLPSKLQDWRREQRLPVNPTSRGPLTDRPDYSYPDGRPVQAGQRQAARAARQRQLMERITQLISEMDLAERLHAERTQRAQQDQQQRARSRLKPKATDTLDFK